MGTAKTSHKRHQSKGKKSRANIKIASLNMRGRWHHSSDKWSSINQIMKDQKLGILALQETHLTKDDEATLNSTPGLRIHIKSSIDPARTNAKGVAIVMNKNLVNTSGVKVHDLVPGRALLVIIPWRKDDSLKILAIYAPNDPQTNQYFWDQIHSQLRGLPKPDILLGDFNLVEDALDHLPPKQDSQGATLKLNELKTNLKLRDGWRSEHPDSLQYTYAQSAHQGGRQSRIDRIYIKDELLPFSREWNISPPGIHTDHQMVSARISSKKMPFVGTGRWSLPLFILKNKKLGEDMIELGKTLQQEIRSSNETRNDDLNPQVAFKKFKDNAISLCRSTAKKLVPMKKNKLQSQLRATMNDPTLKDEDKRIACIVLQDQLNQLEITQHVRARDNLAAKMRLENESPASKLWAKSGKEHKPRDTIIELRSPNSPHDDPIYVQRSDKMSELARDYYDALQQEGLSSENEREAALETTLNTIMIKLSPLNRQELAKSLTKDNVEEVLRLLPNGKAPGIDGIPYEFWKWLQEKSKTIPKKRGDNSPFDLTECLTAVLNDIETYGVTKNSGFAEGLLHPLYKKNDRREIANYRPITLLNGDYKTFTKALALKLARTVPSIIHENQAGFIPGRSITDQIRLTQMIMEYAEVEEENGLIVALDQEKAYDKISHEYLWKVLDKFDVPENFTNTVKTLYKDAETSVMINGEISTKFNVTRGVRQGDPLSCLLFDIAIEPLAEMLRKSDLTGFKTKEMAHRIVVTMFADDTTVYLSEKDNIKTLNDILSCWCNASGARFNTSKTEIIPIGSRKYRDRVISSRRTSPSQDTLPTNLSIAEEGKATRILGAWVGNGIEEQAIWSPTLERIEKSLQRWEKWNPSIEGRKIVIERTIGSMTQYLTTAQGMPKEIEDILSAKSRKFIWDGEGKNSVSMDMLCAPVAKGGKNVLHLKSRNEAIELKWLKGLLAPIETRPLWAGFAHAILAKAAQNSPVVKLSAKINPFLQTWSPSKKKLSSHLQRITKAADKYRVRWEAININPDVSRQLPIWFHIGASENLKKLNNHLYASCLREKHHVTSVGQMELIATRNLPSHRQNKNCPCAHCSQDRTLVKCEKPYKCTKLARDILQCILPKWHPQTSSPPYSLNIAPEQITPGDDNENNHQKLFDPTYPSPNSLTDGFRVFTTSDSPCNISAQQVPKPSGEPPQLISIIITGTHKIDKDGYSVSGGGAWFGQNDHRNRSIKVPEHLAAPGAGEVGAILSTLSSLPVNAPLQLMIKSPSLRKNLTTNLINQEDVDWMDHPNRDLMKALVAQLRKRCALTSIADTSKSADKTSANNASALAKDGMIKDTYDAIETKVDAPFELSGSKLHIGTQRMFYKNIRNLLIKSKQRRLTNMNMAMTLYAIGEANGATPTSEVVWLSIRHRDIPKSIRGFLWKSLHGAYKIGEFWDKIPNYENRGNCGLCSLPESMDHILLGCDASPASRVIWKAAKDLWLKRENTWPEICFGTILGCNLIIVRDSDGKVKEGATRLMKILILESAHLIWKLRCERTIKFNGDSEKYHSENEIYNKWLHAINMRLKFDRLLTDSMRYGKKALKIDSVLKTWSGLLKNEDNLPDNWIRHAGVLVGMTPRPPPGRLR